MLTTSRIFTIVLSLLVLSSASLPVGAQQTEEARAAWQVTRYDIKANVGGATGGERALNAHAVIAARNVGNGTGTTFTIRVNTSAVIGSAGVGDATATFKSGTDARTKLQQVTVALPAPIAPGGAVNISFDYRLPVTENSGYASLSGEGAQFLPGSNWYPTPNTSIAPRGADYAPFHLTVNGLGAVELAVTSGQASGAGSATFEQTLNTQPFFLTGKWDTVEGANEARGVSVYLNAGASADERKRADALILIAAAARAFYANLLGAAPDAPVRLVGVRRGAGFESAGTLLVDHSVFRRTKLDSIVALQIAEAVARLWVGGATGISGEGAGVVREGLPRYLATLFLEKQFSKETADAELLRMALLYAPVAKRDLPLAQATPAFDIYFNSVGNKGALVWRLISNAVGRDNFIAVLKSQFGAARSGGTSLAMLRAAYAERGESVTKLLAGLLDQPTDTDLLVGLPVQRAGGWAVALRNTGALDAEVTVLALTDRGERLTQTARIPAKDFGEALFTTNARLTSVEVDPSKLYPQIDFSNDVAPRVPAAEDALAEARAKLSQKPAEAEQLARGVLARTASLGEARIMLGRALLEQKRNEEAEKEFRAALDAPLPTPSTLAWGNIGLGEVALRKNNATEAARRFDEAARAEADTPSTLAARAGRLKAEAAANVAPSVDDAIKNAVAGLDAAVRSGRKAELENVLMPGELLSFERGIISTQPEAWQTRLLRTETLGTNRVDADVSITARTSGRDFTATAVYTLTRVAGGWKLSDIRFFEEQKP